MAHNLITLHEALELLPLSEAPLRAVARVRRQLTETDVDALFEEGLYACMDELQVGFSEINEQIVNAWFLQRLDEAV